jgi:steroid delta-isomerase-like uncharacterized protein
MFASDYRKEDAMSTERNKEVVRRFYEEVLNKQDLDSLEELAVSDYEEHDPLPGQGTGRDGLRNRVSMLLKGLEPRFTIEDLIAEDDRVVARWTNNGTHVGEFLGMPPTNKQFTIAGIDIYRLEDAKMAEHWHVVDMLAQLIQLGIVSLPGGPPES